MYFVNLTLGYDLYWTIYENKRLSRDRRKLTSGTCETRDILALDVKPLSEVIYKYRLTLVHKEGRGV